MTSSGEIRFYVDTLIVETVLGDNSLQKTAQQGGGMLSGLLGGVKEYFSAHVDPNNKVESVLNDLAPGAIFLTLRAIGVPFWLDSLIGIAASAFHIDVASMVRTIWEKVRDSLHSGQPITPQHVDAAVQQAVQENVKPATDQEAEQAAQQPAQPDAAKAWDKSSFSKEMRDAIMVRAMLEEYDQQLFRLTKEGAPRNNDWFTQAFSSRKSTTGSLLGRIIGWIFKVALISAGLMVAGDLINKWLGQPNALDHTYQAGKPSISSSGPATVPAPVTTQTKFKANTSYQSTSHPQPWVEAVSNDQNSIQNMLVNFTKSVYSGLDGLDSAIESSPRFQAVRDQIVWYNHTSAGDNMVYIPQMYASEKDIVDHYIDEVAKNAG